VTLPFVAWAKRPVNLLTKGFTALVKRIIPGPAIPPKP